MIELYGFTIFYDSSPIHIYYIGGGEIARLGISGLRLAIDYICLWIETEPPSYNGPPAKQFRERIEDILKEKRIE